MGFEFLSINMFNSLKTGMCLTILKLFLLNKYTNVVYHQFII